MEAFLVSTGLVALAEIGDKTQLLSLLLIARYRRPGPILLGIAVATVLNHALAGLLGNLLARALPPEALRWLVGVGFLLMAAWALKPDRLDGDAAVARNSAGIFAAAALAFFLAEIGDKTQIATVALAARFEQALAAVVLGTTAGMLLANAPVVLFGERLLRRLPLAWIRRSTAIAFVALGILVLLASDGVVA